MPGTECPVANARSWLTWRVNDYGNSSSTAAGLLFALFFGIVYFVLAIGIYAVCSWLLSRVFRKAGIERWKAWVPVYNVWVILEMGGQPGWLALLSLVPAVNVVGLVFVCIAIYHLDAGFGKPGAGWLVLYIFLPIVWLIILAFDDSRWDPSRMAIRPLYGANVPWPGAPGTPETPTPHSAA